MLENAEQILYLAPMKYTIIFIIAFFLSNGLKSQSNLIGGVYDGRELFYEGMPTQVQSIDTSSAWTDGRRRMVILGRVLNLGDGKPVSGVIIYYYQTNDEGRYKGSTPHGDLRGWVKTDEDGKYAIYSSRPGAYPESNTPAHIHLSVLEPEIGYPYYLDQRVFDDDILLTPKHRESAPNRGGSCVLRGALENGVYLIQHNIILGLNIPQHPGDKLKSKGLQVGEDLSSFLPRHIWGPDKGSKICPVSKYQAEGGMLFFVGGKTNLIDFRRWLAFLEDLCCSTTDDLHLLLLVKEGQFEERDLQNSIKNMSLECLSIAIANDSELAENNIGPLNDNTVIIYRRRNVKGKFLDLQPSTSGKQKLLRALDEVK